MSDVSFDSDPAAPSDEQRRRLLLQQMRQAANAGPVQTAGAPAPQSVPNVDPSTVPVVQAPAPAEPSPILGYLKNWFLQGLQHPFDVPPRSPPKPLSPEEQAMPYRDPPRIYDAPDMADVVTDALQGKGSASVDDMVKLATYGSSLVAQPLRGVGDIVNLIRGTKYPRYQRR